jgi:predicted RNase H-related nuclease YkuK (DUF458 family)
MQKRDQVDFITVIHMRYKIAISAASYYERYAVREANNPLASISL